jgi:uncharacterized protein (TIGR02271 family)
MYEQLTVDRLSQLRGVDVYDSAGEKIGEVEEIFYDESTNRAEWIGIGTGFLGTKRVLVPVQGADITDDGVTVRYSKEQVKGSPDIDSDEINERTEQDLYAYYGLGGAGREVRDEDASITRSEEELRVGKREVEAGRARLRKWVETEPVQEDVELRRETARVTREPVDQPVSGAEIGEEEIEVPLRGEQAVAEKRTVAKERVSVEKDVQTERETVGDELRKERVEIEGDQVKERKRKR